MTLAFLKESYLLGMHTEIFTVEMIGCFKFALKPSSGKTYKLYDWPGVDHCVSWVMTTTWGSLEHFSLLLYVFENFPEYKVLKKIRSLR